MVWTESMKWFHIEYEQLSEMRQLNSFQLIFSYFLRDRSDPAKREFENHLKVF